MYFELKILRYMKKHRKQPTFSNETLAAKFGVEAIAAAENAYNSGYLTCETTSSDNRGVIQVGFPELDNWSITPQGQLYVSENKLKMTLTTKEKIIHDIIGFAMGIVSTVLCSAVISFISSTS